MVLNFKKINRLLAYNPFTGDLSRKTTTSQFKSGDKAGWINAIGYRCLSIERKTYLAHRVAWLLSTRSWPKDQIDHINHNRADNRWCNLREATRRENQRNVSLASSNTSGYTGVFWSKQRKRWQARITIDDKQIHLGFYLSKDDAISARVRANKKYGFHKNHGVGNGGGEE